MESSRCGWRLAIWKLRGETCRKRGSCCKRRQKDSNHKGHEGTQRTAERSARHLYFVSTGDVKRKKFCRESLIIQIDAKKRESKISKRKRTGFHVHRVLLRPLRLRRVAL